jgi:ribonuclease P protein component
MALKYWLAAVLKAANASVSRSNRWHSLRHRAEFLHLQKDGQKWVTPAFIVHLCDSKVVDFPHVGFTVTKKIGNAVMRNRIRRRLRAMIDQIAAEENLPKVRIALTARSEALDKDFQELARDFKWALRKMAEKKGKNDA